MRQASVATVRLDDWEAARAGPCVLFGDKRILMRAGEEELESDAEHRAIRSSVAAPEKPAAFNFQSRAGEAARCACRAHEAYLLLQAQGADRVADPDSR